MTAPRSPRAAWLLVGSTPVTRVKVQSAGQRLSRLLAKRRWYFVLLFLRAACLSRACNSCLSGLICACRRARVSVLLVVVPGLKQPRRDRKPLLAELLLGWR